MSQITKRKHVLASVMDDDTLPNEDQFVAKIEAGRGNNLHQVLGPDKAQFLVSMPTCFRRNVWVKRGDYVICQWIPEGDKVKAEIVHPLSSRNVEHIEKEGLWPSSYLDAPSTQRRRRATDEMFPSSGESSSGDEDGGSDFEEEDDDAAGVTEEKHDNEDDEENRRAVEFAMQNFSLESPAEDKMRSNQESPTATFTNDAKSRFGETVNELVAGVATNDSPQQASLPEATVASAVGDVTVTVDNPKPAINAVEGSGDCDNEKLTRKQLEKWLTMHDIQWTTVEHPEVLTVEDALHHLAGQITGHFAKNLFLRDKKRGSLYLLIARHDAVINLNVIGKALGCASGRLRFGPEAELAARLGVRQGCVSLFALLNDTDKSVTLLLEKSTFGDKDNDTLVWFHPLTNAATTGIKASDVFKFVDLVGHRAKMVEISADGAQVNISEL